MEAKAMMAVEADEERSIWRDRTAIMLGYFCFLRTSEVARMVRGDISFERKQHEGVEIRVMRVHVNRLCKNDKERKGHTRFVQGLGTKNGPEIRRCMVRSMAKYLMMTREGANASDPLFPKQGGGHMTADGPRGRLKRWLGEIGVRNAHEYGFHSMRAGAATAAAQAGVPEQSIKLAGNWSSDNGVRPYIRPQLADQLRASDARGAKREAPAARC
jgi:integrase